MAQPSKAGVIVLFCFGLPFFAFGAFASFAFFTSAPSVHNNSNPIAGGIFASVFAMIGAAIMVGAVAGYRQQKRDAEVKDANPDSPWLWRKDWAESRAVSKSRNTVYGWWIGTVLLSMLFVPMAAINVPSLWRRSDPALFLLLGLCLLPALLLIGALRASIRRERYGKTYFEFASLPFSPGKKLRGQIHLRLDTAAEHGIDLRLSCIRRIVTGSGKERSTSEVPLWQQEKNVPQPSLVIDPLGTSIPVEFEIPEDAYETNHDVPSDQVLWMLHAQADVPGVDYNDDFEIPVFRSSAKAAGASAAGESDWAGRFQPVFSSSAPAPESLDVLAPARPKVRVSPTAEGATEFYFPAFRNRGRTLILLLVTAGWTALVYVLSHSKAPWFFPVAFGFFDLLLLYGSLQGLFGTARILVGGGKLVCQRGTLTRGTARDIPFSDIQSVQAAAGVQQSSGANASYMIRVKTKSGSTVTLADSIADREEARWIVAQIEKLAGLKIDTRVSLQGFGGGEIAPPPQRDLL
ncbi:MAG TPA: hypothetical protein VF133_20020 [Terriglobales bacterium]